MWKSIKSVWRGWVFTDAVAALFSALGWTGLIMSVGGSALFGYWAWSESMGHLPTALIALAGFAVLMVIYTCSVFLRTKDRPSKAAIAFDYNYGIALEEISPAHDDGNEENCLEFRFHIRNAAPGPLKYKAERIDVLLEDRIKTKRNISGVLPRNASIKLMVGGFEKSVVDGLDNRTSGTYEFSIVYGHPDDEFSHRAKKTIKFWLVKKDGKVAAAPWNILEESDEEI